MAAIGPFSIDMYLPALPMLGQALGTTAGAAQASLAVFFLGMALGQIFYGPLADRYGRRLPLFIGLGVYTVASLICALAPNIESLIAARLMQALGGCTGMVISRAVVRDVADERGAIRLMARLMLVMGVAPIIAPIIGGALLGVIGWRGIFLCLAAYGAILLLVIALFLPETQFPMRAGLPQREPDWLKRWEDMDIYGRQRAAGQAQQEHRQGRGRLHQGHHHRARGERRHQPSGCDIVHPHRQVRREPGKPKAPEHGALEGGQGGRKPAAAVSLHL
jgi:Bcr/CflA subfamily drug resistance transporter